MKIITQLSGESTDGLWAERCGWRQVLHIESQPGHFRQAMMGSAGLVIQDTQGHAVAIPLAELVALAEQHEPKLLPPMVSGPAPIRNPGFSPPLERATLPQEPSMPQKRGPMAREWTSPHAKPREGA